MCPGNLHVLGGGCLPCQLSAIWEQRTRIATPLVKILHRNNSDGLARGGLLSHISSNLRTDAWNGRGLTAQSYGPSVSVDLVIHWCKRPRNGGNILPLSYIRTCAGTRIGWMFHWCSKQKRFVLTQVSLLVNPLPSPVACCTTSVWLHAIVWLGSK